MRYELRQDGDRLRLLAGTRETLPLIYCSGHPDPAQVALFGRLGVPLVSFPATCDFHLYRLAPTCWTGPDTWDHSGLDASIATILEGNPDALLLPRVFTCTPPWWDERHPDELVRWHDGTAGKGLAHGAAKRTVPSLASGRWRRDRLEALRRFVRHVEDGPHASRVAGYLVTSGNSEEWFHWGTIEGHLFDYGPRCRERWRGWLRGRYGDDRALSAAWGREVALEEAPVPDASRRRPGGPIAFVRPRLDQDLVDYGVFLSDLVAEAVCELAALVKTETDGRKLFGTFYGYLLELAHHPEGLQAGGHLALSRVLASGDVDFLASPGSYARRDAGGGHTFSMVPTTSVRLHGKAFFHENDVRTHVLEDDAGYGRTESAFHTASVQRREFAFALTGGHGLWWFDMTGGWFDEPVTIGTLRRLVGVARRALELPRRDVAEIALVVDEDAILHALAPPNQLVNLLTDQCLELSRTGAPFDVVRLADLADVDRYRLVVLPALFHVEPDVRERLHAWLRERAATALFVGFPGTADAAREAGAMRRLTGIGLTRAAQRARVVVEAELDGRKLAWGSWSWWVAPVVADDPSARVLGRLVGGGAAGLVLKEQDGWRSAFSSAPAVCGEVLRHLAREAGVHLFVEGDDGIYACSRFVAVHARSSGRRRLTVPGTDTLLDLEHDVELRARDGGFDVHLPRGETALLFRGGRAAWQGRA